VDPVDPDPDSNPDPQHWFCDFFMTFLFENYVNVASKSNQQKIFLVVILKVADENNRIKSRILSRIRIIIRGLYPDPIPKCHGSGKTGFLFL
jgi:hypothetical protein